MDLKKAFALPSSSEFQGRVQRHIEEDEGELPKQKVEGAVEPAQVEPVPVDTWSTSNERELYLNRRPFVYGVVALCLLLAVVGWLLLRPNNTGWREWIGYAAFGFVALGIIWCLTPYMASRHAFAQRRRATAAARVDLAIRQLGNEGTQELPLTRLFQLNRRQLDEYQEMTKKQQKSAFLLTQMASVVAFLALVVGVVISFQDSPASQRYVAAGLSGLGALLSSFLASTFYKAHADANRQLNLYYLEPQRTGRILAAERLARDLREDPGKEHVASLIEALLRWEMPGEQQPSKDMESNGRTTDSKEVTGRSL